MSEPVTTDNSPSIRLATNIEHINRSLSYCESANAPALLVSFVYLTPFLNNRSKYVYRNWVMDSGAFSAEASGTKIDLMQYTELCQRMLTSDPSLVEVFALDVIGDWRASRVNTERMWAEGVPAIPCYHVGEPWDVLTSLCKEYPKVALGGAVGLHAKEKLAWAKQCFARVWPKKLHGFGFGSEVMIMALPFHSTDATNWEIGACKFGRWQAFGQMSVRGGGQNLRAEVEHYLKIERQARSRWRKEMLLLETLPEENPTVRLAVSTMKKNGERERYSSAFQGTPDPEAPPEEPPAVRLAFGGRQAEAAALAPTVALALPNAGREPVDAALAGPSVREWLPEGPIVRLALGSHSAADDRRRETALEAPTVRLALQAKNRLNTALDEQDPNV